MNCRSGKKGQHQAILGNHRQPMVIIGNNFERISKGAMKQNERNYSTLYPSSPIRVGLGFIGKNIFFQMAKPNGREPGSLF
jgi:hypothetical protein